MPATIFVALFTLLISSVVQAQNNNIRVKGRVTNDTGQPALTAATVEIKAK